MWYLVKWQTQLHHVAAQTEEERRGHRSGWKTDLILVVRFSIVTNIRLMVLCNKTSSLCVWTESFDDVWWCHYLKKRHQAVFSPLIYIKKALKWAYLLISDLKPQVAIISCDNVVTIAQAEWSQWTVFFFFFPTYELIFSFIRGKICSCCRHVCVWEMNSHTFML